MIRLRWPTGGVILDINIPNAQLGNTESQISNAIVRENRGLQPITYKNAQWPTNIINRYSIKTMNLTERNNIIDFLTQSAGDEIFLTDHDNQVWLGIIITPIPEIVTMRDNCSYDIEFEFQGRRL